MLDSGSGSGDSSGTTNAPVTNENPYATITLNPPANIDFVFDGLTVTEELNKPFDMVLDVSSNMATGQLIALLGSSLTLTLKQSEPPPQSQSGGSQSQSGGGSQPSPSQSRPTRYFNGIMVHVEYAGMAQGAYRYHIELKPWIWLLSRVHDCKIYQNQTAWQVITSVFRDNGFSDFSDKRQNQSGEIAMENCVQYHESSLDFVTRLMELYGIYYYYQHEEAGHSIVFADDPNSHTALPDEIPYSRDMTESRTVDDHIWSFSSKTKLQPGAVSARAYNFTTPSADLTAKSRQPGAHTHGGFEVFNYPGTYDTAAHGQALADVRMQNLVARRHQMGGESNARGLRTGVKMSMGGFQEDAMNQSYLITKSTTTIGMGDSKSGDQGDLTDTYRNTFEALPETVPFRPDVTVQRPMIRGPQSAKVVGAAGDEITTDQYGRVKVKFYWDRSAAQDETASCWIRVSQMAAGQGFGAMSIPRVGEEVVVIFLDGNPDRPIIVGRVYNANVTVPYGLPDNKTRTTIKTNSSPGGGGFNELRFEDKKGSEEVFLQAQKDFNRVVVQGNDTLKVQQGDRSITIDQGSYNTTVAMANHTVTVAAGSSTTTAAQAIELMVAGSSIRIAPEGITITAPALTITAPMVTINGAVTVNGVLTVNGALVTGGSRRAGPGPPAGRHRSGRYRAAAPPARPGRA